MKLVTQTDCLAATFGDEEAVKMLAAAGFDGIDWSFFNMLNEEDVWNRDDWREHALELKSLGEACGIVFRQAHAPFPTTRGVEPFDTQVMEKILRSMEAASLMGIRYIVVHPIQHLPYRKNRELLFEKNVELYRGLIPHCERLGIHVCCENMWQYDDKRGVITDSVCARPEEFCALVDAVGSEWIVGCLDIGHTVLTGEDPADFIRALGSGRLKALHVHDVDYRRDCHTLPFMERLDWDSITAALREIGYAGDFTFEADQFLNRFPEKLRPEASGLMAKTGRYLISLIETGE